MTLVPNTFQSFNVYIDRAMELLSDAEFKVLMFSTRHIMGWQDKIDSRIAHISISMFEHGFTDKRGKAYCGTGLGRASIINALNILVQCGFLDKVGEPTADGQAWKLSERDIHWDYLTERKNLKAEKGSRQTEKARAMKTFVMVLAGLSNLPAILVSPTNQRWLVQLTIAGLLNKLNQRQDKAKSKPIKDSAPQNGAGKTTKTPKQDDQECDNGVAVQNLDMWVETAIDQFDLDKRKAKQMIEVLLSTSTHKTYKLYNLPEPLKEPAQLRILHNNILEKCGEIPTTIPELLNAVFSVLDLPLPEKKKRITPHEPYFFALAAAFGIDATRMSDSSKGMYYKAAYEFYQMEFPLDLIPHFHKWCQRQEWRSFSVMALAKHAPDWLVQHAPKLTTQLTQLESESVIEVTPEQQEQQRLDFARMVEETAKALAG